MSSNVIKFFSITTLVCFAPCSLPARWLIASQPEAGKETGLISSAHNSGIGQITQGDLEIIFFSPVVSVTTIYSQIDS